MATGVTRWIRSRQSHWRPPCLQPRRRRWTLGDASLKSLRQSLWKLLKDQRGTALWGHQGFDRRTRTVLQPQERRGEGWRTLEKTRKCQQAAIHHDLRDRCRLLWNDTDGRTFWVSHQWGASPGPRLLHLGCEIISRPKINTAAKPVGRDWVERRLVRPV